MPNLIICPKCDLNYIEKKEKFCKVCKSLMGMSLSVEALEEESFEEKLCPVCSANYLAEEETVCFLCSKEEQDDSVIQQDIWEEKPGDDDDDLADDDLEVELGEEEPLIDIEDEEDFSHLYKEPDDFEYGNIDQSEFETEAEEEGDEDDDDWGDDEDEEKPKKKKKKKKAK